MNPVAKQLRTIIDELSGQFYERKATIEFLVLCLLAKEHGFILGPPGTSKSMLVRALVERLDNMDSYFEMLMSRTRPDAAVLGPYNLPELRDHGDFHRKIAGFFPSAVIAFLDEIGKMSPTSGHDLLSILNERIYHEVNGGRSVKDVPLHTCFTASNELIANESDDAAALWDRLLLRTEVNYIQETSNFASLLKMGAGSSSTAGTPTTVEWADLVDAVENEIPKILLPQSTVDSVIRLRGELANEGLVLSDRRWKQTVRVMQANAFLNDRTEVVDEDIIVYRYTLWDTPEQIDKIERLCLTVSNPEAEKILEVLDAASELMKGIDERHGQSVETRAQYGAEVNQKVRTLESNLKTLQQEALQANRGTQKVEEALEFVKTVKRKIYTDCLDMDPDQVKI